MARPVTEEPCQWFTKWDLRTVARTTFKSVQMNPGMLGWTPVEKLTVLPRLLNERIDATLPVVPLRSHGGDVVPAHGFDDVHHGLGLVGIRGHHAGEEVVAGVVAELGGRGGVAHLRDLRERKKERGGLWTICFVHINYLYSRKGCMWGRVIIIWHLTSVKASSLRAIHPSQLARRCFK